jgi:secreted PhoX family phosphatase
VTRAPALRADPQGILDLPEGFSYRVLQRGGEMMTDGYRVPGRPDAMACFAGPNARSC